MFFFFFLKSEKCRFGKCNVYVYRVTYCMQNITLTNIEMLQRLAAFLKTKRHVFYKHIDLNTSCKSRL